jgi:hypothetical protein
MDSSIDNGPPEADSEDLPVSVTTLELDGVRPKVGDKVDMKVSGTIRKLVDETAFVKVSTVNDQPLPPKLQSTEEEDLMAAAQQVDGAGMPPY